VHKAKKISPAERRGWLESYENGGRVDDIARRAGRGTRSVKDHIETAQAERDLMVVRQSQLREALVAHQRDLIDLLSRIRQAVEVPQLEYPRFLVGFGPDFGLERLLEAPGFAPFRHIGLGSALGPSVIPPVLDDGQTAGRSVYVLRDQGGPREVHLTEENTRLWRASREHLRRSSLWKDLDQWKQGLLEMLQARAELNRMIQRSIEDIFRLRITWVERPNEPNLRPALVSWLGWIVTKTAGGAPVPDPARQVNEEGPGRIVGPAGAPFAKFVEDPDPKLEMLWNTIPRLVSSSEAQVASRTESEILLRTTTVRETLEELMLIHFVPGKCSICRKLGGA